MKHFLLSICLLLLGAWGPQRAWAQAPAWQSAREVAAATAAATTNYSEVTATAVGAAGEVYVVGNFTNTVVLGSTTLTSLGNYDVFIARFNPASNQFVWVTQAGGVGRDYAYALATSGTSVYVAGTFFSPTASFGSTALTNAGSGNVFVAKLTSAGSFGWAQAAGGTSGSDGATALAVSGASVYVAGSFESRTANFGSVTLTNVGNQFTHDVYVAKLIDAGSTGSFAWAQRAGGASRDYANALTVSGANVYVAGSFASPTAGFGAAILANAGSDDAFVAKLTDAGPTGSFEGAQRAGGTSLDVARALAANGASVYVAGDFSATAGFGATTLTTAGNGDVFVAKLTDAGPTGSFGWAQRAGGTNPDNAAALAVSGTSLYVAGGFSSATAAFGSATLANAGGTTGYNDVFVAKLTDAGSTGSFAWAQRAGGTSYDRASSLALGSTSVYVAGSFNSATADFSPLSLTNPYPGPTNSPLNALGFLARLTDPTLPTAAAAGRALAPAQLFPNPAHGTATLRLPAGTAPAPLTLTDAQGRAVRRYPAPAAGTLETALDLRGLPAGLYGLRGAGFSLRLQVE